VPHAGSMCLLDQVLLCDATEIECSAISHRDADNPLRHNGVLPIHVGIEYCAQAIAIHGRLCDLSTTENRPDNHTEDAPRRGYLAVILNTEWQTDRLDLCAGNLHVFAKKQVALQQGATYSFALKHEGHTLLVGQAVVALE